MRALFFLLVLLLLGLSYVVYKYLASERRQEIRIPPPPKWRFPQYGTNEFFETCPWTSLSNGDESDDDVRTFFPVSHWPTPGREKKQPPRCITKVHPSPNEYEGLSEWLTKVVSGYIDATLRHCLLLLDYGYSIDVHQVIQPVSVDWSSQRYATVDCSMTRGTGITSVNSDTNGQQPQCYSFAKRTTQNILSPRQRRLGVSLHPSGIHIPNYRHIFKDLSNWNATNWYNLYEDQFEDLKEALPGFHLEIGFACSMASTMRLANPQASQFQQDLFDRLLPQLRDPSSVVIAVYIRTGQSDQAVREEKYCDAVVPNQSDAAPVFEHMPEIENTLKCVRQLEILALERGLPFDIARDVSSSPPTLPSFPPPHSATVSVPRIVWLMVTDSVPLKAWIESKYDEKPIVFNRNDTSNQNSRDDPSSTSTRRMTTNRIVLTTTARGIHTRTSRNPQTDEFAEAMIDWFLMGEADALVTSSRLHTFGTSAALRTAVPIFEGKDCSRLKVVHEGPSPNNHQRPYVQVPHAARSHVASLAP